MIKRLILLLFLQRQLPYQLIIRILRRYIISFLFFRKSTIFFDIKFSILDPIYTSLIILKALLLHGRIMPEISYLKKKIPILLRYMILYR